MQIYIVIRILDSGVMDQESIRSFAAAADAIHYRNELFEAYGGCDVEIISSPVEFPSIVEN